jgi:hypothetical protein
MSSRVVIRSSSIYVAAARVDRRATAVHVRRSARGVRTRPTSARPTKPSRRPRTHACHWAVVARYSALNTALRTSAVSAPSMRMDRRAIGRVVVPASLRRRRGASTPANSVPTVQRFYPACSRRPSGCFAPRLTLGSATATVLTTANAARKRLAHSLYPANDRWFGSLALRQNGSHGLRFATSNVRRRTRGSGAFL